MADATKFGLEMANERSWPVGMDITQPLTNGEVLVLAEACGLRQGIAPMPAQHVFPLA